MSTIPAPAGGIVGVIRRALSSASGAKAGISVFSKPEIWAVRLAMAAGILAIYMKSGADEGWTLPVIFSLCIGIPGSCSRRLRPRTSCAPSGKAAPAG